MALTYSSYATYDLNHKFGIDESSVMETP